MADNGTIKRQSSFHLSTNEKIYEKINKNISFILLIYCIIQLAIAFSDKEMPKYLDIGVNIFAVLLSGIGFWVIFNARIEQRKVNPS